MTASRATLLDTLKEEIGNYFGASLADFYGLPAHRLMIYTLLLILTGLGVAVALSAYDHYNELIDIELKFIGTHAWHTAANMTITFIFVDLGLAFFIRPWGAYQQRNVGKAWAIFLTAFLLGFLLQRSLTYRLIVLYDPELFYIWKYAPSMRPDALSSFLFALPFWLVVTAVAMKTMTSKQTQTKTLIDKRIAALLADQARPKTAGAASPGLKEAMVTAGSRDQLQLPTDPGIGPICASDIGHITAEDHYLRIYFYDNGKLRNTLIRMPLKELATQLPQTSFVRIHRSHMVNLAHVSVLKRSGRAVYLEMKHGDFVLPVSRSRQPQVVPVLNRLLTPKKRRTG